MKLNDLPDFLREAWTYSASIHVCSMSQFTHAELIRGRLPCGWHPRGNPLGCCRGWSGGKKGLISPSLVKKKKNHNQYSSYRTVTAHWRTRIQLTCCKVSWKTDVAGVTYRILLMAFHCLSFPFIHSNPLTMELRDVVNDGAPRELQESGSLSRRRVDRGVGCVSPQVTPCLTIQRTVARGKSEATRHDEGCLCYVGASQPNVWAVTGFSNYSLHLLEELLYLRSF